MKPTAVDPRATTRAAAEHCENHDLTDCMVIGTSAIVDTELDGAVGMNSGIFNNPFLIWDKYQKGLFRRQSSLYAGADRQLYRRKDSRFTSSSG